MNFFRAILCYIVLLCSRAHSVALSEYLGLDNTTTHVVRHKVRRNGANRVFGSWGGGSEEAGSCGLRRDNRRRGNLMDLRLDGRAAAVAAVAGADFRREDLLE